MLLDTMYPLDNLQDLTKHYMVWWNEIKIEDGHGLFFWVGNSWFSFGLVLALDFYLVKSLLILLNELFDISEIQQSLECF